MASANQKNTHLVNPCLAISVMLMFKDISCVTIIFKLKYKLFIKVNKALHIDPTYYLALSPTFSQLAPTFSQLAPENFR